MKREEILLHLQESFHQIAPEIDFLKIKLDKPLREQVEIDSLDLYNIIGLLQKKTGIFVSDSQLATLPDLSHLIDFIFVSVQSEELGLSSMHT